ncbi:hypothetical protein [Streptoalloteichus hindustanus]|nr:hypothetical protein [Streptoalloteichus hindustanus]
MRDEDREVVARLRDLASGPAPGVRTGLAEVVARGRRRLLWSRAGSALGAVVVVGALGAAAIGWGADDLARPLPPAGGSASTTSVPAFAWPRVDLPPRTPYGTWSPGWTAPPPPDRPLVTRAWCSSDERDEIRPFVGSRPVDDRELRAFMASTRAAAGPVRVSEPSRWDSKESPGSLKQPSFRFEVDLTDEKGTGSLAVEASRLEESPERAADRHAFSYRNCQPPHRKVLPDGTVLQMYEVVPSEPFQSLVQKAAVYRPDGTLFTLSLQNWGSPDVRPDRRTPGAVDRFGPGRATLPLGEAQLAAVAEGLARRLG